MNDSFSKVDKQFSNLYAKSINDVHCLLNELLLSETAQNILLALDIDMTLTQPEHPATSYPNINKHKQEFKKIISKLPKEHIDTFWMLPLYMPQRVIEDNASDLLKELQSIGIHTIAFTAALAGAFHTTPRFEVFRYQQLQKMGFYFQNKLIDSNDIIFKDCPAYRDNYPAFYKGILCSNGEMGESNKGNVLISFLKKCHTLPKIIIMLDDREKNLNDISHFLRINYPHIEYIGIQYVGSLNYNSIELDKENFCLFWNQIAQETNKIKIC